MAKKARARAAPPTRPAAAVHTVTLYVLVFVCGAVLMSLEIVGSRILAPWFGSSVYVWGSLIGIFLGALSIGYFLGGKIADWQPRFAPLALLVMAAGVMVFVICFAAPYVCGYVADRELGNRFGPLVASLVLFLVPSVLLGTVSPYAVRLRAQSVTTMGKVAGVLYALSTLGSIVGTFLTTFVLIMLVGVRGIVISLAITLIGVGLALLAVRWRARLDRLPVAQTTSFLCLGVLLTVLAPARIYPFDARSDWGQMKVIDEADSPYQHIVVTRFQPYRTPGQPALGTDPDPDKTELRLQFDDYLQSAIYVNSPNIKSAAKYTDLLHLPLAFNPKIGHVLVIGGGGCVIPMVFRQSYPWMDIDVVEIDPTVIEMARKHFRLGEVEDERLRVYVEDGRMFLRRARKKYDLIILDAYSAAGRIPVHLITREFFQEVADHLTDRGMALANIISAMRGRGGQFYLSTMHTAAQVFRQVYVFPRVLSGSLRPRSHNNLILILRQDAEPIRREQVVANAENLALDNVVTIPTFVHYARWMQPGEQDIRDVQRAMIFTDDHNAADLLATK